MTAGAPDHHRPVFQDGGHRVRRIDETWSRVASLLPAFGITRLADVTGLDTLGIPVYLAVRPHASTLTVSQGKGRTALQAKVSAAMEAIELWHAEHVDLHVAYPAATGAELRPPYDLGALDSYPGSLLTNRTPLDWLIGRGLVSGQPIPVPRDAVWLRWNERDRWRPRGLRGTSNGLASGNSVDEAAAHALCELIERDSKARLAGYRVENRTHIDPETVHDPHCAELISRIRSAGAWLELVEVENRCGVPCYVAYLWSDDFPAVAAGAGAHIDPAVALSRAVVEAAQSRLTVIAGTRDDIKVKPSRLRLAMIPRPATRGLMKPWPDTVGSVTRAPIRDLDEEVRWLARRVESITAAEPVLVDLSTVEQFAVVKVIGPGLKYDARHSVPRPA